MHVDETEMRTCSVYRGHGDQPDSIRIPSPPPTELGHQRQPANAVPLSRLMSRDVICARPDLELHAVVRLMMRNRIGCLPVVDSRQRPIGMITKHDLVEQLDAAMHAVGTGAPLPQDLQPRCADELMMPLAFTLDEHATIAHAASMMMSEDTHHVIVVSEHHEIVGVVSSRDIVAWLAKTDGS